MKGFRFGTRRRCNTTTPEASKGLPKVNSPCKAVVFMSQLRSNKRCENDPPLFALWRGSDHSFKKATPSHQGSQVDLPTAIPMSISLRILKNILGDIRLWVGPR